MTIDKAIEILGKWEEPKSVFYVGELVKAKQLGIEALKRIEDKRKDPECRGFYNLPGETET